MTVEQVIEKWRNAGASRQEVVKRLIEDGYSKAQATKLVYSVWER